jgi:2,3-bisphosphoglycerate-dependent phosphoglycerate mutase
MHTVVLIRHGQSVWNLENLFAGWVDVGLSPRGQQEALAAADLLKGRYTFDLAYTSYLRRAQTSLELILDRLDQLWIPEHKSWRLNERHYGSLQGLNRVETLARFGEDQFNLWRRSYTGTPPPLAADSPQNPALDPRYATVAPEELPLTESLAACTARILPYWSVEIVPQILSGARVLICAHGSTLRALVKHLKGLSDEQITRWNVPTAVPLVLTFDNTLKLVDDTYLGDPAEIQKQIEAVARQGYSPKS